MSDETGAVAAAPPVESPAVAEPQVETPAPQTEETVEFEQGGKQARRRNALKRAQMVAARQQTADRARERALQPREEAGKPEGGQFKAAAGEGEPTGAGDAPKGPSEAKGEAPLEGSSSAPVETSPEAGEAPPPGYVRIPLPEDHPLRDRGKTHLIAHESEEREVRSGINAAVKARQLEAELESERQARARLEARQAALSGEDIPKFETDPMWQERFRQIRETEGFGEEVAETLIAGLKALEQQKVTEAETGAVVSLQQQSTARSMAQEVFTKAPEVLQVWHSAGELDMRLNQLLPQYCDAVDKRNAATGRDQPPTTHEFFGWVAQAYRQDPRVQSRISEIREQDAQRERERIRAEERAKLEEERKQHAEEVASRHRTRPPLGRQPTRTTHVAVGEDPAQGSDPQPQSATQRRRAARERAREAGSRFAR